MTKYRFSRKNSIWTVSFRNCDDLGAMQRTLAWQWLIGNVDYADVCEILLKEKTYTIPDNTESRLAVVPQLIYKGKTYDPDTDSKVIAREGQLKGCYIGLLNSVYVLPDSDRAVDFITRLNQVEDLWAKAEAGKELPTEEPPLYEKKKPTKSQASKEEQKKPTKSQASKEEQRQPEESDKEEDDAEMLPNETDRPQYDLWGQLSDDNVAAKLKEMTRRKRERLFEDFLEEYEAIMAGMQRYASDYLNGMMYYAHAIEDFNGETSAAAKFLKDVEEQPAPEEPPKSQQDANGKNDKGKDAETKLKNYIARQLKKVKAWIKEAEDKDDEFSLDILDDMKIALNKGDVDKYKVLKSGYERLTSAGQQTNPGPDSSTGDNGPESTDTDTAANETESDDAENKNTEDEKPAEAEPGNGKKYPVKDVIMWMNMVGVKDIPSVLKMSTPNQEIDIEWVNDYMVSIGSTAKMQ